MKLEECQSALIACPTQNAEMFARQMNTCIADGKAAVVFKDSQGKCRLIPFSPEGEKAQKIAEALSGQTDVKSVGSSDSTDSAS